MEGEHLPAAGVWIEQVGDLCDGAGALVVEREGAVVGGHVGGQPSDVLQGLPLDAGEGARGLGLDGADRLAVGVEHVVGVTGVQRELTHRHATGRHNVEALVVLHLPAAGVEHSVDLLSGFLFRCHGIARRLSLASAAPRLPPPARRVLLTSVEVSTAIMLPDEGECKGWRRVDRLAC